MKIKFLVYGAVTLAISVGTIAWFKYHVRSQADVPDLVPRRGSTLSSEFREAQQAVDYYRSEIQKHPGKTKNYIELAQIYLQESRVTGLHHIYVPKAQYLLDKALEIDPGSYEGLITKASTKMTQHQFADAYALANNAVRAHPEIASGWGVLCDAQTELGMYADAIRSCDTMLGLKPDLRAYARASYQREIHGDIKGAEMLMKLASEAGVNGSENRVWALYNLGNLYLHEGKSDTAAFIFNGALEERPSYAFAMSGLAQVKAGRREYQEAIDLLSRAYALTPEHLFVEQLADIYAAAGEEQSALGITKIVDDVFKQHEQGGWNINKEYALFASNHDTDPDGALKRAAAEIGMRPDNIDALDAYAWALCKNGKSKEAVPVIEKALRLGTKSSAMEYHAAKIYNTLGDRLHAKEHLERSLAENLYVNVVYVRDAQQMLSSLNSLATTN